MTLIQYQDRCAKTIAEAKNCICIAPGGAGLAAIAHQAALLLKARNVLVCAPKSIICPNWKTPLDLAFQNDPVERVLDFSQAGKDINACRIASLYDGTEPLFYLATHVQISGIGAWCDARRESPFDLIIADGADAFLNTRSERSRGLENAALNGQIPCVGFVRPENLEKACAMFHNIWGGPRVIDTEPWLRD